MKVENFYSSILDFSIHDKRILLNQKIKEGESNFASVLKKTLELNKPNVSSKGLDEYERRSLNPKTKEHSDSSSYAESLKVSPNLITEAEAEFRRRSSLPIWKDLSKQYDIRNLTFEEFEAIAYKLEEAGVISHIECSIMTYNPTKHPDWNGKEYYYYTQASIDGRRDWIAEFEMRAKINKSTGEIGWEYHQNIANLLRLLERSDKPELEESK